MHAIDFNGKLRLSRAATFFFFHNQFGGGGVAKRASRQPIFLAALIRSGYLPTEVPPTVTTRYYADFCRDNYIGLKSQLNRVIKLSTKYDTYTVPKPLSGRRNLALVHPLAQLGVSLLITQNRARIKHIISKSGASLYRTTEDIDNFKAFAGLDFRAWSKLKSRLYSNNRYILIADISRFFYTAYTHSLPWAVIGKERAKEWLAHNRSRLDGHWSSQLDRALQACQSRETFGLPVGPDTSRVLAEILLAGVQADSALRAALGDHDRFRLLDDFVVGFDTEHDARRALTSLRRALWKFNLQLNEEKTKILPSSLVYEEQWRLEIGSISLADIDGVEQEAAISRLIDITLSYCSRFNTAAPAS